MQQLTEFFMHHWVLCSMFGFILTALAFEEWRQKTLQNQHLTPQDLARLTNEDDVIIIDIRPTAIFAKERILNAINVPFTTLDNFVKSLAAYKTKQIVIVDALGTKATEITTKLKRREFNTNSLNGGMAAWKQSGLPMLRGK